ncbi:hypothetical protein ARALYDRAFT_344420 [Arabidopsis lyrata subsp. lyrata]|uniref:Binding protein n=1 Tax=Arabidopsis lyrata subsp. lyrata TaxID=81972 RepID=D7LFH1_ARALL|nr:hypothetical protein ARALYDRAFT_344420 [Arabidopsis lyrata subsp. lyrata]
MVIRGKPILAFGGGRTLRPGDSVETAEERIVREKQTKKFLIAYKESIGLNIDPKLKLECEKAIDEGNSLMDSGRLKEALPYYEKSELHGLAALQWSICQDSLRKRMYEKLLSHPNPRVSKKARQLMFSFQAMEMLKVKGSSFMEGNTGYQDYFEAFDKDKTNYKAQEEKEGEAMGICDSFCVSDSNGLHFVAALRGNMH